jgi:putative flippase GtrA
MKRRASVSLLFLFFHTDLPDLPVRRKKMLKKMEKLVRYLKFMLSTLGGTAVDCGVMWLLAEVLFAESEFVGLFIAPTVSFECAVLTNYTLAYFFVWKDRVGERSVRGFWGRFLPYNVSCIAAFLIKMVPFILIRHFAGLNVVLCNLIALVFSGIFNFVMNEWVIFRKKG